MTPDCRYLLCKEPSADFKVYATTPSGSLAIGGPYCRAHAMEMFDFLNNPNRTHLNRKAVTQVIERRTR